MYIHMMNKAEVALPVLSSSHVGFLLAEPASKSYIALQRNYPVITYEQARRESALITAACGPNSLLLAAWNLLQTERLST